MTEEIRAEPPPTEAQTASRWEDYVDVFISPVELYRRRAHDRVAPPLITLLVLAVIFYFVLLPANSIILRSSMAADPDAAAAMERFTTLFQVLGSIAVPITYTAVIAFSALLLWLVGRLAEVRTEFSRTMLIATYAGFVFLLAQIAASVAVLLHGEAGLDVIRHTSFGPLRFVGSQDMSPVTAALLRRFELFTIWQTVLWAIGIAVIYNTSRVHAAVVAVMAWALTAVPAVLMAVLGVGQGPPRG